MPNRIIREGIIDSEAVNSLSWQAEVFYRRLMSVVDDFGRFDARPSILRSRLYPLKLVEVRESDVSRWTAECEKSGLIRLYATSGKQYLTLHKLGEPRAKASKFPPPPDAETCAHVRADENICAQTRAYVPYSSSPTDSISDSDSSVETPPGGDTQKPPKRFVKPSVEDVAAYCRERGNSVDPEKFVDFYESKGWKVGKNPMVDWKAAVRNWEKDSTKAQGKPQFLTREESKAKAMQDVDAEIERLRAYEVEARDRAAAKGKA